MSAFDDRMRQAEANLSEIEAMPAHIRELLRGDEDIAEAYEITRRMMRQIERSKISVPA